MNGPGDGRQAGPPAILRPVQSEERDLVSRCVAGDAAAWTELSRRHANGISARIAHVFGRRTGHPPSADWVDEATQEVFIRLARGRGRALAAFEWRCSLSSYLQAVAATHALYRIRAEARRRGMEKAAATALGSAREAEPDPETAFLASEEAGRVREAVAALPRAERDVVRMRVWDGLAFPEIALALGLSEEAARSRFRKAAEKLRKYLGPPSPSGGN